LAIPIVSFTAGLKDVEKFFQAEGSIIAVAGNHTYVCNKGLPYFKPNFPVAIYQGTKIKNPLTGTESLVLIKETGKGKVIQSFKNNAIIFATEDKGVKVGNIVKLAYSNICFKGSDFSFEKLLNVLPVVKNNNIDLCKWAIEETNNGFKVLFKGQEVFFTQKALPNYAFSYGKLSLNEIRLVARTIELQQFNEIPIGIDAVKNGKRNVVVIGFPDKILIFEKNGNSLFNITSFPTPTGVLVGIRILAVGAKIYIIGNAMTSDAEPVSFVATLIGTNPVLIQEKIPYLIGVLNKEEPQKYLFVQKFTNGFGEVYRATIGPTGIKIGKKVEVPSGFRVDTAIYTSDGKLVFIDPSGILRVFKGSFKGGFTHLIDIDGKFGQSYTYIDIPSAVGSTSLERIYFPPPPVEIQLFGFKGFLVASNTRKQFASFLLDNIVKFHKGKLIFIGETQNGSFVKKALIGGMFEDSIQGITIDKDGTPFVVSGWKNPLLFREGGKLYKILFRYF